MTSKTRRLFSKSATYILLILVAVIVGYPFLWMLLSSFKDISEFYMIPPRLFPEADGQLCGDFYEVELRHLL